MLELMFCSLLTIVPDYLYRRYVQGKRIGREITIYSVWFELRWGITTCLILTVLLITTIFYNHPSTSSVTLFFRTIPILPEASGRVAEVYVGYTGHVDKGAPIFRLDSSKQEAARETARRKIAELDADIAAAKLDILKSEAQIEEAQAALRQAQDELEMKQELQRRNSGTVAQREIERLQLTVRGREANVAAAQAARELAQARYSGQLPADKATAEAALREAEVDLSKTVVRAGVSGQVEQFVLRVGDIVNPLMRPAGVLIPDGVGERLTAGFSQIEAQVMTVGMIAEVACVSKPFQVIPMVVSDIQEFIPAGQFRGGDQLIDPQSVTKPGTLIAILEPLYKDGLKGVTPGSSCLANAYSSNHDEIVAPHTGTFRKVALHALDALALVHAIILRLQALILPFQTLVFSGGH
jgi:multidrug resistance efflux pump